MSGSQLDAPAHTSVVLCNVYPIVFPQELFLSS